MVALKAVLLAVAGRRMVGRVVGLSSFFLSVFSYFVLLYFSFLFLFLTVFFLLTVVLLFFSSADGVGGSGEDAR